MPEVPVIMFSVYRGSSTEKVTPAPWARLRSSQSLSTFLSCSARRALCSNPDSYAHSGRSPPAVFGDKKVCCLHFRQTGVYAMMHDFELARGDICGDPTGLQVRIEDVDTYDYVHFSVIRRSNSGSGEAGAESGQMSHVAFAHRCGFVWKSGPGHGFQIHSLLWMPSFFRSRMPSLVRRCSSSCIST